MDDHHWDSQGHLSAAVEAIATERRDWKAEQAAWKEFRKRIRELSNAPEGAMPVARGATMLAGSGATMTMGASVDHVERLQCRIRTAYSETVMATPAAEELEDVPAEHMAAELGPDISNAVFISTDPPSNLLTMVDQGITSAVTSRERVVEKLDDEEASVERLGEDLAAVREELDIYESIYPSVSFRGLIVYYRRLGELRAACADVANRRQNEFHTTFPADYTRFEWSEYLYRNCEADHPVLAAVIETVDRIDEFRRTLATDVAMAEGNLGASEYSIRPVHSRDDR